MNQKEITRLAVINAVRFMFTGITDDEHALFVFETMDEFPADQVVTAIDVNGAIPMWLYEHDSLTTFMTLLHCRVDMNAKEIELNMLVNTMQGA